MPHHFNDDDPDHNDYIGSGSSNPYQGTGRFGSGGTDEDEEGISNEESARRNQGTGTNPDNPYQGTGSFSSGGTGADTSPGEGAGEPAPTQQQQEDEERGSRDRRRRRRGKDQPSVRLSESQEPETEAKAQAEPEPPSHWNAQNGGEEDDGRNTLTLPNLPGAVPGSVNNPVLTGQGATFTDTIDTATTRIANDNIPFTDSIIAGQLQSISDEIDALEAREEFGFVELTGTEKERLEELKTQRDKLTDGGSATGGDQTTGKRVVGQKLVGYDGQGEPIYEPVYETIPAIDASSGETPEHTAAEETTPVSRADFGGTEVGTVDTTPTDPTNAPETTEGADVDTRPDGEYHDGDSYTIVSTDSNGNRHISKYRVEKDGEVRFGDNYLEEQAIERPDGGTTIRSYVHPGLKAAIDALESKSGTTEGLTDQEQQHLAALQGQRNEMSGRVWSEVWDTPETRKVAAIAVQVELAGRILTGSSSIGEQRAFNLKKGELLDAIQNLPNATLRERYSQHYGRLLDTTRGDWMQANYQHESDTDMAQAEANLNLAIERFAAAGAAIPLGTNTTPEFQQARNELVRALNAIPGEEARAAARAKVVSILEKQGSDFVTEKIATGSDFTETFDQSAFLVTPTEAIPPHSLLSAAAQSHIDVQQRVADILDEDLTADTYYERRASLQEANTEYGNAVDEYERLKAELEPLDDPASEQIAEVQSTLGSLLETQAVLIAWGEHLDTFYEGNTEAIALVERDSADRSDFAPQYEFIDPSRPEQKTENLGDWNSIAFDLSRSQKVLGAMIADLDRRIKEYEQSEGKDWGVGNALREESARLAAESHFQNQVSDQLFQTVTGQERTGDKEADDRTFDLGWQRFSARDVNPYTPHGEAIRRYNFYTTGPTIGTGTAEFDRAEVARIEQANEQAVLEAHRFLESHGVFINDVATNEEIIARAQQKSAELQAAYEQANEQAVLEAHRFLESHGVFINDVATNEEIIARAQQKSAELQAAYEQANEQAVLEAHRFLESHGVFINDVATNREIIARAQQKSAELQAAYEQANEQAVLEAHRFLESHGVFINDVATNREIIGIAYQMKADRQYRAFEEAVKGIMAGADPETPEGLSGASELFGQVADDGAWTEGQRAWAKEQRELMAWHRERHLFDIRRDPEVPKRPYTPLTTAEELRRKGYSEDEIAEELELSFLDQSGGGTFERIIPEKFIHGIGDVSTPDAGGRYQKQVLENYSGSKEYTAALNTFYVVLETEKLIASNREEAKKLRDQAREGRVNTQDIRGGVYRDTEGENVGQPVILNKYNPAQDVRKADDWEAWAQEREKDAQELEEEAAHAESNLPTYIQERDNQPLNRIYALEEIIKVEREKAVNLKAQGDKAFELTDEFTPAQWQQLADETHTRADQAELQLAQRGEEDPDLLGVVKNLRKDADRYDALARITPNMHTSGLALAPNPPPGLLEAAAEANEKAAQAEAELNNLREEHPELFELRKGEYWPKESPKDIVASENSWYVNIPRLIPGTSAIWAYKDARHIRSEGGREVVGSGSFGNVAFNVAKSFNPGLAKPFGGIDFSITPEPEVVDPDAASQKVSQLRTEVWKEGVGLGDTPSLSLTNYDAYSVEEDQPLSEKGRILKAGIYDLPYLALAPTVIGGTIPSLGRSGLRLVQGFRNPSLFRQSLTPARIRTGLRTEAIEEGAEATWDAGFGYGFDPISSGGQTVGFGLADALDHGPRSIVRGGRRYVTNDQGVYTPETPTSVNSYNSAPGSSLVIPSGFPSFAGGFQNMRQTF